MDMLVLLGLIILLVVREYTSFTERKDMLDRLMARSLPEYKDNSSTEPNKLDTEGDPDVQEIDEAKEELMNDGV